jgi:predicted NBD/HSP70 family sugar kinase
MLRREKSSFYYYRILRRIWRKSGTSRIELARRFGLDKSTVTHVVNNLLGKGLVAEEESTSATPAQAGRKPRGLAIASDYGLVAGLELARDQVLATLSDLQGRVLLQKSLPCHADGSNLSTVFHSSIAELRKDTLLQAVPLLAAGVAISGLVNPATGVIKRSLPLQITTDLAFAESAEQAIGCPVFVDNDANCCAWGMLVRKRRRGLRDFLYALLKFRHSGDSSRLHQAVGLGLGIVIDGRVHYGRDFSGGEFRSLQCGPSQPGQFSLSEGEVLRLMEDAALQQRFLDELASHLALLVNTFNFSHLFIGGDLGLLQSDLNSALQTKLQENWPYSDRVDCHLEFDALGAFTAAAGAGGMVLERLFSLPSKPEEMLLKNHLWEQLQHVKEG